MTSSSSIVFLQVSNARNLKVMKWKEYMEECQRSNLEVKAGVQLLSLELFV